MKLLPILCDASGNQKFERAANTPEMLTSQLVYNLAA